MLSRKLSPDGVTILMQDLEQFVILMYDITNESVRVNAPMHYFLTRIGRALYNIMPTESALITHTNISIQGKLLFRQMQAGYFPLRLLRHRI